MDDIDNGPITLFFIFPNVNQFVSFFSLERKEPKLQVIVRSFWLDPERTKEIKIVFVLLA